jgi:ketosteroid isomerase-like protein
LHAPWTGACAIGGGQNLSPRTSYDSMLVSPSKKRDKQTPRELHVSALDQMLATTFVYTEFDGSFSDKTQFLQGIKSSGIHSDQITNQDVLVSSYGDSAVVIGIFKEKGIENGKAFARRGRFTDTWVKQNGIWLCVASQATLINHH